MLALSHRISGFVIDRFHCSVAGHLLLKFFKERLEDCLGMFRELVRKDLKAAKSPGAVDFVSRGVGVRSRG